MYPLLFTLSFLLLLGFSSLSEFRSLISDCRLAFLEKKEREIDYLAKEAQLRHQFEKAKESLQLEAKEVTPPREKKPEREKKERVEKTRGYPLHFDECRPPNNSRLNFFLAINKEKDTGVLSAYEIAARLIRNLYEGAPFYFTRMEYGLLDRLKEQNESALNFSSPDELATLTFDDDNLQEAWVKMLKGTQDYPSLLWFLTWKRDEGRSQINFLFAPNDLLMAIFNREELVSEIDTFRETLIDRLNYQEEHRKEMEDPLSRSEIKNEIERAFQEILSHHHLSGEYFAPLFDFSLGQIGDTFYFEDQESGMRRRKRLG